MFEQASKIRLGIVAILMVALGAMGFVPSLSQRERSQSESALRSKSRGPSRHQSRRRGCCSTRQHCCCGWTCPCLPEFCCTDRPEPQVPAAPTRTRVSGEFASRLDLDSTSLTCELSGASNTGPHLAERIPLDLCCTLQLQQVRIQI